MRRWGIKTKFAKSICSHVFLRGHTVPRPKISQRKKSYYSIEMENFTFYLFIDSITVNQLR